MKRAPIIVFVIALIFLGMLGTGYLPRVARARQNSATAASVKNDVLEVTATTVQPAKADTEIQLPGNIQAITEAVVFARADGYVKRRFVDIGDRVKSGQELAELESPEVDQQLLQARANLQQSQSALGQAQAAVEQAKANLGLAEVTSQRWQTLVDRGVLAKQEGDEKNSAFLARRADVTAAEANVRTVRGSISANEANVQRLVDLQAFQKVRAPFAGIITARNIDVGSLVSAGSSTSTRELFHIAQIDRLRTFVNVPQSEVSSIHVGMACDLQVTEMRDRPVPAKVARTANSLDPASRTLLTEVQLANPGGTLLPGMYVQVRFHVHQDNPALVIPGDALIMAEAGPQVAFLENGKTVRFRKVRLGRDYGTQVELLAGVQAGDRVVTNPSDEVREGRTVKIVTEK